eukprot:scaffold69700_cov62-Phaeocystis_antarctica.AAC.1
MHAASHTPPPTLNPQALTTQHPCVGREISDSLLYFNDQGAASPTPVAPQPPCSCLLTTLTPDAHFWPGDRAQDEQPTLQGGPSHTGAHDAHNSHRAIPLEPHRVPQEPTVRSAYSSGLRCSACRFPRQMKAACTAASLPLAPRPSPLTPRPSPSPLAPRPSRSTLRPLAPHASPLSHISIAPCPLPL